MTGTGRRAVETLGKLLEAYRQCLDATRRLCVSDPLGDEFEAMVAQRGELMTRIRELDRVLTESGCYTDIKTLEAMDSAENGIGGLLNEIHETSAMLIEADKNLVVDLEGRLQEIGSEIKRISKGQATLRAYKPFRHSPARVIDRTG